MDLLVNDTPCLLFEDDHLLVVNKPPGWNTHAPAPYAGEGIYDWLRNREPRWARLAIIHRLDKDTSGVLLFTKTELANRSLTQQFTERSVEKKYELLTTVVPAKESFRVESNLVRAGEKYFSRPPSKSGDLATTEFRFAGKVGKFFRLEATPLTGRTHQIRVHAAEKKIPVLGDALYGGAPFARLCLHARELAVRHPSTHERMSFTAQPAFFAPPSDRLRKAIIEPARTNAFRLLHGAGDRQPNLYLDRWGDFLLAQTEGDLSPEQMSLLKTLGHEHSSKGIYHKRLRKSIAGTDQTAPLLISGEPAPDRFHVLENGVSYEISFREGYSVGLFLDQRDNRRRLLTNCVAPDFELFPRGATGKRVLNTFAYTCGFSVCAALVGAITTSLDLSKKYLEWGRRNFEANHLDPTQHDFIFGDVFEWSGRLAKKARKFDLILLDPPTFSRSRSGSFAAERDYGKLVTSVLPLLEDGGVLFCSTNAQKLTPEDFLAIIEEAAGTAKRKPGKFQYIPQPPDFPISKGEPGYLKTVWLRF